MDFWSTFNAYHQVLEVVLPKEKNSGQLGFRGQSYGPSKRVRVVSKAKLQGVYLTPGKMDL